MSTESSDTRSVPLASTIAQDGISHPGGPDVPGVSTAASSAATASTADSAQGGTGLGKGGPLGRFGVQRRVLFGLLLANGLVWMAFFTPVITVMPAKMKVLAPEHYTSYYSIALTAGSIFGLFAGPIAGHLSDTSTSRLGRRRPWLLGSMLVGFVGLMLMAFAVDVPMFVVGSIIGQVGFGATTAMQLSLVPEYVAPERRGAVGALLGVSTAVATIIGVVITGGLAGAGHISTAFVVVGLLGVVSVIVLASTLTDPRFEAVKSKLRVSDLAKAFYISPRQHPDFAWAWLSRFMVYLALASVTTYQVFYLSDQLHIPAATAEAKWVPIGTAAQVGFTVIGAVFGGPLSDRFGRRKPFVALAAAFGLAGLVCLALAPSIPLYLAGIALIGLAGGAYASVDIALITAVLPNALKSAGKDLGVLNIANALPNTIAPAFAPALLAIGIFSVSANHTGRNYTMLFLGSAVFALVSVVSVFKVRGVR